MTPVWSDITARSHAVLTFIAVFGGAVLTRLEVVTLLVVLSNAAQHNDVIT